MYIHGTVNRPDNPIGTILIAHGYAEHSGRYQRLTEVLVQHNFVVYRYDHPGHGLSDGTRATVDVNNLVREHYRIRQQIRQLEADLPLFLLGHSMGGLITAASTLAQPDDIAGVVLSGPALGLSPSSPIPIADALYEAGKLIPRLPVKGFDADVISRDHTVVENYLNDPLNYIGSVPLLTGASMSALGHRVQERMREWTPDVLFLQGAEDNLVDINVAREFSRQAGTNRPVRPSVDYIEIPVAQHEVFNEPEGPVFMTLAAQWLKERC